MRRLSSRMRRLLPAVILVPLLLFLQCGEKEREGAAAGRTLSTEAGELTLISVGNCFVAERLVSYELWSTVRDWAEDPARGEGRYSFTNPGRPYPAYSIEKAPESNEYEPVVSINWKDAATWMNAFTEWYNVHGSDLDITEPLEPVYYTDAAYTVPVRRAKNSAVTDDPFVNPDAAGFRLLATAVWETAYRMEIYEYDEEGNPKRRWLFPDIDGLNSEWCFDRGTDGEDSARSWRGGGEAFRSVQCSCAVSPPIRSMSPERTSGMLGLRFCINAN
jgi:hypothetical protein